MFIPRTATIQIRWFTIPKLRGRNLIMGDHENKENVGVIISEKGKVTNVTTAPIPKEKSGGGIHDRGTNPYDGEPWW